MKKSKVIIPAMALLLFSTAASVTGTVAWFSSTRVFNMTAASFGINSVDDGLKAELQARVGTTLSATGTTINADTNCWLYHGSVNIADVTEGAAATTAFDLNQEPSGTGDVYVAKGTEANAYDNNTATSGAGAGGNNTTWRVREKDSIKYYVAFSWKITFTHTFSTGTSTVGVYLDTNASTFVAATGTDIVRTAVDTHTEKTQYGFRVGFFPAGGTAKVFGHNTTATATSLKYVNGTAQGATGTYTASNYLVHDGEYARLKDKGAEGAGTEAAGTEKECLYTLSKTAGTSKEVICIAWYEGEDPNVITEAQMDKVTANLTFYMRKTA